MNRHNKTDRGKMGAVIAAILVSFFAIHLALPEITLWPFLIASLVVIPMLVRHFGGSNHRTGTPAPDNISTRR